MGTGWIAHIGPGEVVIRLVLGVVRTVAFAWLRSLETPDWRGDANDTGCATG